MAQLFCKSSRCNVQQGALTIFAITQEYVNGQLKNKFGDAFIRGNNGRHPSPSELLCLMCHL